MSEWRGIETAPKDGTRFLATNGKIFAACCWYVTRMWLLDNPSAFRAEHEAHPDHDGEFKRWEPTHWMPLPEPPSGEHVEEE